MSSMVKLLRKEISKESIESMSINDIREELRGLEDIIFHEFVSDGDGGMIAPSEYVDDENFIILADIIQDLNNALIGLGAG